MRLALSAGCVVRAGGWNGVHFGHIFRRKRASTLASKFVVEEVAGWRCGVGHVFLDLCVPSNVW